MSPIFLLAPGGLLKAPLEHCLTRAIRRLAAGRPGLFERLGSYRSGRFLLGTFGLSGPLVAGYLNGHPGHRALRLEA